MTKYPTFLSHIEKILFPENAILQRVNELGQQISYDYQNKEILLICILKGALVFVADLIRCLDLHADLDFVQISSYGNRMESSGSIKFIRDIKTDIEGRNILIVDDIIDSGLTLYQIKNYLLSRNPLSLKTCVLLDKPIRRTKYVDVDYIGFEVPDEFVVGYGLDFNEQYRGLRYIAILKSSMA
jgi:hypoxanthine phosphoribosyltransferase